MSYTAIDFETANASRSSPCAVGVVVVDNGKIVDTFYSLIRPKDGYFDPFNIFIHGITPDDVADKPEFPDIFASLKRFLDSNIVIAHNAAFDMSVLRQTLELYRVQFPEITYSCSRIMAKKSWPTLLSYSLPVVAEHIGITFEHHNALSDAKASGLIAHEACKVFDVDTLDGLAQKSGMRHGQIMSDGSYRPATGSPCSGGSYRIDVRSIVPSTDIFDEGHFFFGKVFAFSGTLQSMTRREAMQSVVNIGGQVGNGVTKETNFLVIGEQDIRKFAHGQTKSSKFCKAETLKQKGCDIELLSESDYLQMLERKMK